MEREFAEREERRKGRPWRWKAAWLLAAALLLGLTGCGGQKTAEDAGGAVETSAEDAGGETEAAKTDSAPETAADSAANASAEDAGGKTEAAKTDGAPETATDSAANASAEHTGDTANATDAPAEAAGEIGLTLWTYPIGGWGSSSTISPLVSAFHRAYPDIEVTLRTLDYVNGDAEIEEAIAAGETPDIVVEGPERLTANWGARGLMADLSDLWESETAKDIYEPVEAACRCNDGNYYIYPLCMTTHCMAVNRDLFEEAGAWQYVDEETHTWSTDDFIAAAKALRAYGVEQIAAVYCAGQGGDQGTRALVNNLYSGTFTDPEHTRYTVNSPENVKALELLKDMEGVDFDGTMVGTDEIKKFCSGELAMCFCWNVGQEITQTISNPDLDFDIFPMAFPTDDDDFNLQGGIWGFGIFDNGDAARIEAAKTFIRFLTENESQYTQAVLASTFWPVRDVPNIYENDELMTEYSIFQQYLGDYYQITPGWVDARTAWWNMLQKIGNGTPVQEAVEDFEESVTQGTADEN